MLAGAKGGYCIGLDTIVQALEHGERDLNYWRDSVRWLAKASTVVRERSFCLQALNVMHRLVSLLDDSIRGDVVRASCSLAPVAFGHVEVLERLLWMLVEISTAAEATILGRFCADVVDKIVMVGELSKTRVEIMPSLIRLIGKVEPSSDLLRPLAEIVLREDDAPGKVLWTLADHLPLWNASWEGGGDDTWICQRMGLVLLSTSSLKAKLHLCKAIGRVLQCEEGPCSLRDDLSMHLQTCRTWLERDGADNHDIDATLYWKYRQRLEEELNTLLR